MTLRLKIGNRPLWPNRAFWLGLLFVLLVAAALRFTGYNFSLPYVDHPDEPYHMLAARAVLDSGSPKAVGFLGYPPGMFTTNYLFVRYLQDPAQPVMSVLWMVRLLSITVSLGNVVLVGLLARQVAGDAAGLGGAVLWAIAPVIVEFSRFATPDSYVTFFSLLAIYLIIVATSVRHRGMMTAAVLSCLVAILYKYQAVVLVPLILGLPFTLLRDVSRDERKTLLLHLLKLIVITGVFGLWLLLIYPSLEARNIPYFAAPVDELAPPSLNLLADNLRAMLAPIWTHPVWLVSLAGIVFLFLRPFRAAVAWGAALVVMVALGLSFFSISLFGVQAFRQFIFTLALLTVFHGVGLAGWWNGALWLAGRMSGPAPGRARLLAGGIAVFGFAVLLLPTFMKSVESARQHTLPDQRNFVAGYVDTSLPPAPYIADYENEKTLNRDWGGYPLAHDFPRVAVADLTDQPLEEWHAQGVEYAIVTDGEREALESGAAGEFDSEGVTLLKSFPPTSERRGPASAVYWLHPIPTPMDEALGPVHVRGYQIDQTDSALTFTLFWQADQPLDSDYAVFNHLVNATTGELVAQADGAPLYDVRRPTTTWDDPAEILISQPFTIELPADLPTGDYELRTGFYRRSDGVRLQTADGEDVLPLTSLTLPPRD